jgi:hypothetical protein
MLNISDFLSAVGFGYPPKTTLPVIEAITDVLCEIRRFVTPKMASVR